MYYVAALGSNNLDKKLAILYNNLNYIHNDIQTDFDVIINCYDNYDVINNYMTQFKFISNKMFHNKSGVLTELFLTNPYNHMLKDYDYILFILDDVEIQNVNINNMIAVKKKYNIEIISPGVINATHKFMYSHNNKILTINNALEVFCLLLSYNDFVRFLSMHTIKNKWMWGADFLFGHYNIKAGVYFDNYVKHMLPSNSDHGNAFKLMNEYLKNHNINSINDIKHVVDVINV
jgi:hypothetical protein